MWPKTGVAMILTIAAQAQNVGKYGSKLVISGVKGFLARSAIILTFGHNINIWPLNTQ